MNHTHTHSQYTHAHDQGCENVPSVGCQETDDKKMNYENSRVMVTMVGKRIIDRPVENIMMSLSENTQKIILKSHLYRNSQMQFWRDEEGAKGKEREMKRKTCVCVCVGVWVRMVTIGLIKRCALTRSIQREPRTRLRLLL